MCWCYHLIVMVLQVWLSTNPRGAERLPPEIVVSETDFYQRRLWGLPEEVRLLSWGVIDVKAYLVSIYVHQKKNSMKRNTNFGKNSCRHFVVLLIARIIVQRGVW